MDGLCTLFLLLLIELEYFASRAAYYVKEVEIWIQPSYRLKAALNRNWAMLFDFCLLLRW